LLLHIHPRNSATTPFLGLDSCFPEHLADAEETIRLIQNFDADERVFVVFAHDVSMFNVVDFFPHVANEWKLKRWKEKVRWTFLIDLQKLRRIEAVEIND
jgi:hypothetical protein